MSKVKKFMDAYKDKDDKKKFVKKFKKSLDFRTALSSVDAGDQLLAEKTANPELVKYLKSQLETYEQDIFDIPLEKGILKVTRRDRGLYSGVMTDKAGEVIERFNEMTVDIMAKNLMVKDLDKMSYSEHAESSEIVAPDAQPSEIIEDLLEEIDEKEDSYPKAHVRIKCGDIEIEIKKSIQDFAKSFKKGQIIDRNLFKSLKSLNTRLNKKSEKEAARELIENWETHKEDFLQRLHGIKITGRK